jgi:type II secretory pathway component PulC
MKALRYLVRNATVMNVVLFAVVIALVVVTAVPLVRMRHGYSLPGVKVKPPGQEGPPADLQPKLPSDYAVIGETNLFHPDRVIPVDRKAEVPRPEIVLYGTMIDRAGLAFIEDKRSPATTPGRGKRQRVVKLGEEVGGYTVAEIETDRIVLVRGEDRMNVQLSSPDKRKDTAVPPAPQQPAQAKPVQTPPPAPARPARTVPQPPGEVKPPPLPVGETMRPTQPPAAAPPPAGESVTPSNSRK